MKSTLVAVRAALPLVVALLAASCDRNDSPSAPDETAPLASGPDSAPTADTLAMSDSLGAAGVSYSGIPFGPYNMFSGPTSFEWGPAPFTGSLENTFAKTLVQRLDFARQHRYRLVLAMTGGSSSEYTTNGKFDMGKWKARMNTFNTATIKKAVADAVADGTIIGNKLIDEPETPKWGGVLTKAMIDQMAAYVKNMFPTLPVGIAYGAPGYQWRSGERYKVVDWVISQYQWSFNQGGITAWRDIILNWSRAEGVTPVFSLNIINGGINDNTGAWDCAGTGGKGTITRRCRMTADQVRTWGKALTPYACFMMLWRYDAAYMAEAANQLAFKEIAALAASKPKPTCKRP